jgi:putative spermidine/putrescine transport system substrate-binding protein
LISIPSAFAVGIDINWVDYSGGLSEIKAQKEAGAITWDIIDVFAMDTITGCDEGLFVEFDFDKDFPPAPDGTPASEDFFTSMPSKCAVGNILYSWNYAYNVNNVKGTPKTIKDFFNTKKFPGKRGIYTGALTNLEIALAADGVKPGKGGANIYEALETEKGVERAMNKIKKLCTDPQGGCTFWSSGTQPAEFLVSGEVVMSTGWNGRLFAAEMEEGAPIKQVWDAQGLDYEYFVLVKGGPNEAEAKKALAMMTNTEMLAGSAKYIAYAPWRKSSLDVIAAAEPWYKDGKTEMLSQMPTAPANTKNYFLVDPVYWADNGTELGEKWEAMKAGL